ncbi:MAG: hydrogenase nickel incorporation protein HypB [Anaerolineales bacterium]
MPNIPVLENILSANDDLAAQNRTRLDAAGVLGLNFMASPGAGKTSLIERSLQALSPHCRIGVLDGDIAPMDVERATAAGAQAMLINTGGECHLDAVVLHQALQTFPLADIDLLVVENVGNLICPAAFALGTHYNILIASVPEGDDKPYKYPAMYRGADVLILNKTDLLPYIPFRVDYFRRGVEALNPGVHFFPLSCQSGEGLDAWLNWVQQTMTSRRAAR